MSVFAGTKEKSVDTNDFQASKLSLVALRGHVASLITLSMEAIAQRAPDVTFVHDYPGSVKSGFGRELNKGATRLIVIMFKVVGPLFYIPAEEVGERQLFLATSARYASKTIENGGHGGVPVPAGVSVARGVDGRPASGVYSIDSNGEECGPKVVELLGKLRREGLPDRIWEHTVREFVRITGQEVA